MAYRLQAGESVSESVQRIALEEMEFAAERLKAREDRDEAVHDARKSVKKIRGVLRLVRPEIGPTYESENTRFRNIGHKLSDVRDGAAMLEIFDGIAEKHKQSLKRTALRKIRRGLEQAKKETETRLDAEQVVQDAILAFREAAGGLKTWLLKEDGFEAVAGGLERTYRAGRRALAQVQNDPTPEAYHYFRRRVKDHWYHVRLLESLNTGALEMREGSLKNLEQWLGDDHNLVVLRSKLEEDRGWYGGEAHVQQFLSVADREQEQLREDAIAMGQQLYAQRPKQFIASLANLWAARRKEPGSSKKTPATLVRRKAKNAAA